MNWVVTFLVNALAVVLADYFVDGIVLTGIIPAFFAGASLGIVNTFLRPILMLFTLPFTVVTLGFFILVVNAMTFTIASWLVPGFDVLNFSGAFWGALIISIVSWLMNLLIMANK